MIFLTRNNKAEGLSQIYLFFKRTVKKCRLNIEVLNSPSLLSCQACNKPDGFPFYDRGECFGIINIWFLLKAYGDKASFVANADAMGPWFLAINPAS
jgi:hypothetical protein